MYEHFIAFLHQLLVLVTHLSHKIIDITFTYKHPIQHEYSTNHMLHNYRLLFPL